MALGWFGNFSKSRKWEHPCPCAQRSRRPCINNELMNAGERTHQNIFAELCKRNITNSRYMNFKINIKMFFLLFFCIQILRSRAYLNESSLQADYVACKLPFPHFHAKQTV